jgi:Na+/melibiose symporter-like transporter
MTDFPFVFGAALVLNLAVTLRSSDCWKKYLTSSSDSEDAVDDTKQDLELKKTWRGVLNRYLAVYLLATLSDWLQGAYVYALYDDYGYSQHDIAVLFVAGFGSSMIFGTFVGGMADKGGRRTFVLLYCLVYGASCITKRKSLLNGVG